MFEGFEGDHLVHEVGLLADVGAVLETEEGGAGTGGVDADVGCGLLGAAGD